ncbi:MAG: hypothetical protein V1916_00575 [Patescibacteria group bacterium]
MTPTKKQELDQLRNQVAALGRKTVLLLKSTDLPEPVQLAIVNILPELNPAQIDELISMLTEYVAYGSVGNEELKQKITTLTQGFQKRQTTLEQSALKDLAALEKEIE